MVFGKFLAAMTMFAGSLFINSLYFLILYRYAEVKTAHLIGNFVALILVGMTFIAIGIFVSALTENQLTAAVGTMAIILVFLAVGVIQLAVLALPCMVYYLLKGRKLNEPMLIIPKGGTHILFLIFSALLFVSGMLLIKYFYFVNGGEVASLVNFYKDFSGTTEDTSHIEIILSLIVIPAFCEEFFFRGFGFITLGKYTGKAFAYIFNSCIFAFYHVGMLIPMFEPILLVLLLAGLIAGGCIFSFLNDKTKNIYPSWFVHMFANFAINTVGFILFGVL
jgi:membrane protease YdiL (CAAX protease family)